VGGGKRAVNMKTAIGDPPDPFVVSDHDQSPGFGTEDAVQALAKGSAGCHQAQDPLNEGIPFLFLLQRTDPPNATSKASSTVSTPMILSPSGGVRDRQFFCGMIAFSNPIWRASARRCSSRATLRTSPVSPTSPTKTSRGPVGRSRKLEATLTATAKSTAGSSSRIPPTTLI